MMSYEVRTSKTFKLIVSTTSKALALKVYTRTPGAQLYIQKIGG